MNLAFTYHCFGFCTHSNFRWGEAIQAGEKILPPFKRFHGEKVEHSKIYLIFAKYQILFLVVWFHFCICTIQGLVVAGLVLQLGLAHRGAGAWDRASQLLKEAEDVYKIVPGVQHPFYKDDFLPLL